MRQIDQISYQTMSQSASDISTLFRGSGFSRDAFAPIQAKASWLKPLPRKAGSSDTKQLGAANASWVL